LLFLYDKTKVGRKIRNLSRILIRIPLIGRVWRSDPTTTYHQSAERSDCS